MGLLIKEKKIADSILKLRAGITKAVSHRKMSNDELPQKIINLRRDILNCPYHNFGDLTPCEDYFCKSKKDNSKNIVSLLKSRGLLYRYWIFSKPYLILQKFAL